MYDILLMLYTWQTLQSREDITESLTDMSYLMWLIEAIADVQAFSSNMKKLLVELMHITSAQVWI